MDEEELVFQTTMEDIEDIMANLTIDNKPSMDEEELVFQTTMEDIEEIMTNLTIDNKPSMDEEEFVSEITMEDIQEIMANLAIDNKPKPKPKSTRKSVEYNAYELIVALCMCFPSIETVDDILKIEYDDTLPKLQGCTREAFDEYMTDLKSRRTIHVKKYITAMRSAFNGIISYENVQTVFLEGKLLTSPELIELNANVNNKQAKADVYVKTDNNQYVGLSIKQSSDCTKSNFSVEKMAKESGTDTDLSKTRRNYLEKEGYITFKKEERAKVNALFYRINVNNEYWDAVRKLIIEKNDYIKTQIVSCLYPTDVPYPLYEFDGDHLINLKVDIENVVFEEHEPFYLTKKGKMRNAAKLFYRLSVNNEHFRVEIRWKGNIHTASPQYLVHKIL